MMKQARVEDIANRRITRLHGYIVVITHFYPRFLKRNLLHEYIKELGPVRPLLKEFKDMEVSLSDHDEAFEKIDYESKFTITEGGWAELRRLVELSSARDVYLVCHCSLGQRCHRELILLAAHRVLGASIVKLSHSYPVFSERFAKGAL